MTQQQKPLWIVLLLLLFYVSSAFASILTGSSSSSASRGGSDSHLTDYTALYLAPGFLSKAASLTVPSVLSDLRSYVHGGTTETIDVAPQCLAHHDPIHVQSVNFTKFHIKAVDSSTLTVTFVDLTPLQLDTVDFHVQCNYGNGAFAGVLQLPQHGSLSYVVSFPSPLVFNVTLKVNETSGGVFLTPPVLLGQLSATPTYTYQGNTLGFAADLFVDSFFSNTVAPRIVNEVTSLISFPQNLAKLWWDAANDALGVVEYACGINFDAPSNSAAIWMQPVCAPPNASTATPTLSLLVDGTRDFLFVSPSTDVRIGSNKNDNFKREEGEKVPSASGSNLPAGCSEVVGCDIKLTVPGAMLLNTSNCVVCYPNNGEFTELIATTTFSYQ